MSCASMEPLFHAAYGDRDDGGTCYNTAQATSGVYCSITIRATEDVTAQSACFLAALLLPSLCQRVGLFL